MVTNTETADVAGMPEAAASAPAVLAEGAGKCYHIYPSQRARLTELLSFGTARRHHELWAVKGLDLRLAPGDVLGVVGGNGAGKSTLLKLVTGTTAPTEGRLEVTGRIGALLELGVGFHPEFTGRDNARLSASLMGLSPEEIADKEPAIHAFSELGEFLDQPVKFYSSGMVVRLGFSIAAAIDPDVLVIDEALSVGDQYFQKKSYDRILRFRDAGKTILFCSHSLYHVHRLCPQCAWLDGGRVRMLGRTDEVVLAYGCFQREEAARRIGGAASDDPSAATAAEERHPLGRLTAARLLQGGRATDTVESGGPLTVEVEFVTPAESKGVHVGVEIDRSDGLNVCGFSTLRAGQPPMTGRGAAACEIERLPLLAGRYAVTVYLLDDAAGCVYDHRVLHMAVTSDVLSLAVVDLPHTWRSISGRP